MLFCSLAASGRKPCRSSALNFAQKSSPLPYREGIFWPRLINSTGLLLKQQRLAILDKPTKANSSPHLNENTTLQDPVMPCIAALKSFKLKKKKSATQINTQLGQDEYFCCHTRFTLNKKKNMGKRPWLIKRTERVWGTVFKYLKPAA